MAFKSGTERGLTLVPSQHVWERWEERFPGEDLGMALHFARRIPGITVISPPDDRSDGGVPMVGYGVEPNRVYLWDKTTDALFIGVSGDKKILLITVTRRGQHVKVLPRSVVRKGAVIRKGAVLCRPN